MLRTLLFGILLFCATSMFAQQDSIVQYDTSEIEPLEVREEDLSAYRNNDDFNYEIVEQESTWLDDVKNWFYNIFQQLFEWIFGVEKATSFLATFLQILPYLLLALFLYLVIRFFVNTHARSVLLNKKNPNTVSLSEEERIIKTEDIEQLIKDALAQNDYRLAIRYYYLFILKQLSERNLIDWQRQKTNDDYIEELSNPELKITFGKATFLYDYIWYGEFTIDQERYTQVEQVFVTLKKSINADV
ncbi:DUF4129 domain-containing protein [Flagellimonas zhangzhouensis]|uniref:Protein-glutamine gamma-glutamyltransferase-like C-terminal domain-containing protein n=1 Tax=Flagellimonas zhangzhouensis TaxID=1073328 RepID=A0A1H2XZX0_9FLAO|nr:DUF4129 domain-containing protein [Allomuricauda zhangzhouensis]SDQ93644.1 protein of unknown function [Allomuricauda zhangzhouensis]SDW98275.1 protein of unknown function [Allomuricauda zhangzhouensis]